VLQEQLFSVNLIFPDFEKPSHLN